MSITRFSTGFMGDTALAGNTSFSASDFELISTIRVGATAQSSVTFSNIPQGYKHLQIRGIARTSAAVGYGDMSGQLNGDTNSNYALHYVYGDGASAGSNGATGRTYFYTGSTAGTNTSNIFGATIVDLLDYSSTSKYKTIRVLNGTEMNGSGYILFQSGLWLSTAAVNSILLYPSSGNYAQYSKLSLYGIRG